jgi:GT2 family glycosyltransferase
VVDRLEREFLQREGPEILIERPTREEMRARAVEPAAVDDDEQYQSEFHEWNAPASGPEYPDLHLDAEPMVDVSVIIPTIDNAELVRQCIASCRKHLPAEATVQFLVVDDGTRDRAILHELRRAAKELDSQLLCNHQNLGFSASVNHGMRYAKGRYVVLCNNDVVFFQPWLEALQQAFTADAQLGIVGARLLYPDGTLQHAGVDKVPGQLRFHHAYGRQPGNLAAANQSRYVWCVTGALFAMRRSTLRKLGGLSTAYATAYEDLDFCLHAWMNGERVGYCPDVAAYHLEGGTRGATESKKSDFPLWAERERAGSKYFERKWGFLRYVENFQALLSYADRQPVRRRGPCAETVIG